MADQHPYVHLHMNLSLPKLTDDSPFQPTLDPVKRHLRLFLAGDVSKSLVLEDLTLIAKPTISVLRAGTLRRSPRRLDPLPQPLKVVLKSFDHRVALQFRRTLRIPHWNARREAIYRSLSTEEVDQRLRSLPNGDNRFDEFRKSISGRYTERDREGRYLDHSAEEVDDGLVADEELFVQKLCHDLWQAEAKNYRTLQQEQGRAIPYCFEEVVLPAFEGIIEPKSFLTRCPGLLLEGIRGCTVGESLRYLSKLPGQNIGPLLSKALITLNILLSHKTWLRDIQTRNMMLCTRSLGERRNDIKEYGLTQSAAERGGDKQWARSIACGDKMPTFKGCPTQVIHQGEQQSGPVILSSVWQDGLDSETSYVVFIDLEQWRVSNKTHKLSQMAVHLLRQFRNHCILLGIPKSTWNEAALYMDGRFLNYYSSFKVQVSDEHQRIHDIMMAALCWEPISPMDSMEKYSTCYNISQRGWRIMVQEMSRYYEVQQVWRRQEGSSRKEVCLRLKERAGKEVWWRRAVRRIAAELFSDDPNEAEARFASFLGAAAATNSLPEYPPNILSSTPQNSLSSKGEISVRQLFTKSQDTWRSIEGPPPIYIPG